MSSAESFKLPFVDFSNPELKPGTPEWNSVKIQVWQALQEYGCFEASYNKISKQLRKAIFDSLPQLFELPLETKLKCSSEKSTSGYLGRNHPSFPPIYESMGIYNSNVYEEVESFIKILWPEGNPSFSNTIASYSQQVCDFDKMIRTMVLESLGLHKYIDNHLELTDYCVFLTKYEAPQTDEPVIGLNSHKDQSTLNVLDQNHVHGLQILTKDEQWVDVKPSPDSFIIIVGEALNAWTNGRLNPPYHRVMMRGHESRYSIGYFSNPRAGHIVKAPEELIDVEHPMLFKPYDQATYDEFLLSQRNKQDANLVAKKLDVDLGSFAGA